jgi:predicted RNA-binding protein
MNTINENEFKQLGATNKNGVPYIKKLDDWLQFRKFLIEKSKKRNPDHFDENLAAYTPGETLTLLQNKEITQWFKSLESIIIPNDIEAIILVPCAASKPWFNHKNVNKSMLYKSYNQIINDIEQGEFRKVYFLTISEPLGIIPQDKWSDFPKYDNPGLFKDDFLP